MKTLSDLQLRLFQTGTFLSNLGNSTLVVVLLSASSLNGISFALIGIAIAVSRVGRVVSNIFFGHIVDFLPVGKLIVLTETIAAIFAVLMLASLESFRSGEPAFFLLSYFGRTFFGAFLANGNAKIGKMIDVSKNLNGNYAKVLNLLRSGPIVVASVISYLLFSKFPLEYSIVFDFITFTLNSLIIAFLFWNLNSNSDQEVRIGSSWIKSFKPKFNLFDYPRLLPQQFRSELLLGLVVFGGDAMVARQLSNLPDKIPIALAFMGLGAWLGFYIDSKFNISARALWAILIFCTIARVFFESNWIIFSLLILIHSTIYSVLYNRLSAFVLRLCSQEMVGRLSSSRVTIEFIFAIAGMLWVTTSIWLTNSIELLWRSVVATIEACKRRPWFTKVLVGTMAGLTGFAATGYSKGNDRVLRLPFLHLEYVNDPHKLDTVAEVFCARQIHRGLLQLAGDLSIKPSIAKSYRFGNGGTEITFQLDNSYFSDGSQVTAEDVVRSFRRIFMTNSPMALDLSYIKGAKKLIRGKPSKNSDFGVQARGEKEVVFTLDQPNPLFLLHIATVDSAIIKIDAKNEIVGCGPYIPILEGKKIIGLALNKYFNFQSNNYPLTVNFVPETNTKNLFELAKNSKIDSLDKITIERTRQDELINLGWRKEVSTLLRIFLVTINPKFSESDRMALYRLFSSYESLEDLNGQFIRTYGFVPPGMPGNFTLEHSKSVLAKDKPLFSKDFLKKEITLLSIANASEMQVIARNLVYLGKKVGLRIRLLEVQSEEYVKLHNKGNFDLVLVSKYFDYPDPVAILSYFKSDYILNHYFVSDKSIDRKIGLVFSLIDQQLRSEVILDVQREILKKFTNIPLLFGSSASGLWGPKTKSVPAHPMGLHTLAVDEIEMLNGK